MPINYKEYPPNWFTEIRPAIMLRAGQVTDDAGKVLVHARCENPDCQRLNHSVICINNNTQEETVVERLTGTKQYICPDGSFRMLGRWKLYNLTRIVLTIAHLDHDKTNDNVSYERLRAWCQRCHLNYDRPRHREKFRDNLNKKKGLQNLFTDQK